MTIRQRKPTKKNTDETEDSSPPSLIPVNSSWDKCSDEDDNHDNVDDVQKDLISNNHDESAPLTTTATKQAAPPPSPSPLDNFLSAYSTFSYGTFTADQGLKILQWSSWAIAYLTASHKNKDVSPSFRHVYGDLSMARYALRFYGFFQSLEGYRSGSWAGGTWDNPLIGKIAKYLMCGSMMIYYPLEHVAYAGWQMPKVVKVDANRFSAVSCRYWCAYIVGDFWVSCLKWRELRRKLGEVGERIVGLKTKEKGSGCCDDDEEDIITIQEEQKTILNKLRHVKLQVLRCLFFILPALNWSLPKWATDPLLSEPVVNGLMLAEAYTCVYQSLKNICG